MELNSKLIVNSAWIIDGEVYTGKRHSDCRDNYIRRNPKGMDLYRIDRGVQGFITDEGVFVDRKIAAKITKETGQCKEGTGDILYSEDLW